MSRWSAIFIVRDVCPFFLVLLGVCVASSPYVGQITPGFVASQTDWDSQGGRFLVSNNFAFAFGFDTADIDASSFVITLTHIGSSTTVWTANRGRLISNSGRFIFDASGEVFIENKGNVAWSTNTTGQKATRMVLQDSGNLVLVGEEEKILWQSFSHPTDTLLPGQELTEGMRLKSFPNSNNLSLYLVIQSGDLVLYAGFWIPQIYWSIKQYAGRHNASVAGQVHSVFLASNSWNLYDRQAALLWQLNFSESANRSDFWIAFLGQDGTVTFHNLNNKGGSTSNSISVPEYTCQLPEYCNPYYMCYLGSRCQCPPSLSSQPGCKPQSPSSCSKANDDQMSLLYVGEKLDYFAIPHVAPALKSNNLSACREACQKNCSCNVLFFENSSGNCFLFDEIGSYRSPSPGSAGFVSYVKVSSGSVSAEGGGIKRKVMVLLIVFVVVAAVAIIAGVAYAGIRRHRKRKKLVENYSPENLEDHNFFNGLSNVPMRFSYTDLHRVTGNFSEKIGQGGFGSVYLGKLPDGTLLAIKKLEGGVGQGRKEFRVEVSTIGSIHHVHLVKLKGFCVEGQHRLLVYERMVNGSLDRWIFKNDGEEGPPALTWSARFSIALGIAKGIAYLHDECNEKIVHCDIKPQNILLDENFTAKVSDFGLAKLMSREESLVYTTLRGTRGYLAPEWIKNKPISEKADVYSYGMVLLEIIGGRRNYEPEESYEKAYFVPYAAKMLEEGREIEIVDPNMEFDSDDDKRIAASIRVAFWCIQEETQVRPSMTKVVQMLEGFCDVPELPISVHWSAQSMSISGDESPVESGEKYSTALLPAVQLSGPR